MMKLATLNKKRWFTALVTMGVAFLSGHFMQHVLAAPPVSPAPQVAKTVVLPTAPVVAQAAGLPAPPVFAERVLETRMPRKGGCTSEATVEVLAPATLRLALAAPCHTDQPFRVTINGFAADVRTDAMGDWEVRLPALASDMQVMFQVSGNTIEKRVEVEDTVPLQHVILTWVGPQTFHIQAETHGTESGTPNGTSVRLGDGRGLGFELFSFPAEGHGHSGIVRLAVDAKVTAQNCGEPASVTAYQTGYDGQLRPTEIAYTMPECDRVGETVRLQNLFRDMRLALR